MFLPSVPVKSFFINGWTETAEYCFIFLYTEQVKSLAARLTVSCLFHSYRNISSQYRTQILHYLVNIFIESVHFILSKTPVGKNCVHFIIFICAEESLNSTSQSLVFESLQDWALNIKLYKLSYIPIVLSSKTDPSYSLLLKNGLGWKGPQIPFSSNSLPWEGLSPWRSLCPLSNSHF